MLLIHANPSESDRRIMSCFAFYCWISLKSKRLECRQYNFLRNYAATCKDTAVHGMRCFIGRITHSRVTVTYRNAHMLYFVYMCMFVVCLVFFSLNVKYTPLRWTMGAGKHVINILHRYYSVHCTPPAQGYGTHWWWSVSYLCACCIANKIKQCKVLISGM